MDKVNVAEKFSNHMMYPFLGSGWFSSVKYILSFLIPLEIGFVVLILNAWKDAFDSIVTEFIFQQTCQITVMDMAMHPATKYDPNHVIHEIMKKYGFLDMVISWFASLMDLSSDQTLLQLVIIQVTNDGLCNSQNIIVL